MSPLHAAWLLSTIGGVAFLLLGYLVGTGRGRPAPGGSKSKQSEALRAARLASKVLEGELADERAAATEDRRAAVEAEAKLSRLTEAFSELGGRLERQRDELGSTESRLHQLESQLHVEREQHTEAKESLNRQEKAALDLLAKLRKVRVALAEQEGRASQAIGELKRLGEVAEGTEGEWSVGHAQERELELARTLRDFVECSSQATTDARRREAHDGDAAPAVRASESSGDGEATPDATTAEVQARRAQRRFDEVERPSSQPPEGQKQRQDVRSSAERLRGVQNAMAELGSIRAAVLSDANGLPVVSEGEQSYCDTMAAFSALLAQLSSYAPEFMPLGKVTRCELADGSKGSFTVWLIEVGGSRFALSAAAEGIPPRDDAAAALVAAVVSAFDSDEVGASDAPVADCPSEDD